MSDPRQEYTHYDPTQAGPVFGDGPTTPPYDQHQQNHQYAQNYQYQQHPQYPPPPPGQYTTPYHGYPGAPGPPAENGAGLTALILGICSFAVGCLPLSIGAIIAGHIGMNRVKRGEADNYMHAKAGVIMGYIGLGIMVLVVLFYVAYFVFIMAAVSNSGGTY